MQVPVVVLEVALWAAVAGVGLAALYLLTILTYEWIRDRLW